METHLKEKNVTQSDQILMDLLTGCRITALDALNRYGCFRLAARINELRKDGFKVVSNTIKTESGKRITEYYLSHE